MTKMGCRITFQLRVYVRFIRKGFTSCGLVHNLAELINKDQPNTHTSIGTKVYDIELYKDDWAWV